MKKVSDDLAKVLIDYYNTPKKQRSTVNTGEFTLLHKGKKFSNMAPTCGLKLVCEGKKIKI